MYSRSRASHSSATSWRCSAAHAAAPDGTEHDSGDTDGTEDTDDTDDTVGDDDAVGVLNVLMVLMVLIVLRGDDEVSDSDSSRWVDSASRVAVVAVCGADDSASRFAWSWCSLFVVAAVAAAVAVAIIVAVVLCGGGVSDVYRGVLCCGCGAGCGVCDCCACSIARDGIGIVASRRMERAGLIFFMFFFFFSKKTLSLLKLK